MLHKKLVEGVGLEFLARDDIKILSNLKKKLFQEN